MTNHPIEGLEERALLRPDDLQIFRMARLVVLLDVAHDLTVKKPMDVERLGFYDFFVANPFLVVQQDEEAEHSLKFAGFSSYDLSYQSSGHRFSNRRARLQHDLAGLVSRGAVKPSVVNGRITYGITDAGQDLAVRFASLYAEAYRRSANLILRRLDKMSDRALRSSARDWLSDDRFLIDLYDVETESE